MVHRAASRLGLTKKDTNLESDMRDSLQKSRPEILKLVDRVMESYRDLVEAINQKASPEVKQALQDRTAQLRAELSAAVSN